MVQTPRRKSPAKDFPLWKKNELIKNRFRYGGVQMVEINKIRNWREDIRKMKATLFACVFASVLVLAKVNGVPQGRTVEEEEKPIPGDGYPFPPLTNGPLRKIRDEFIKNVTNFNLQKAPIFQFFNRSGFAGPGGLSVTSVYNTLLSGVHNLYQDLLNRQQAFINLLTCGNCVNEGWNAIMDVVQTVPELEWVYNPNSGGPATFFTAVHQNGSVTGIGGSIVNDKPVAEYAFGTDGIVQHLPKRDKKN